MIAANHNFAHRHGCSLHVPVPVRSHNLRTSVVKVRKSQLSPLRKRARTMNWKSRKIVNHQRDTYNCAASTLPGSGILRCSCHQLQLRTSIGRQRHSTLAALRPSPELSLGEARIINCNRENTEHQRDTPIAPIRLSPDLTLWRACQSRIENIYSTPTRYTTTLLMLFCRN